MINRFGARGASHFLLIILFVAVAVTRPTGVYSQEDLKEAESMLVVGMLSEPATLNPLATTSAEAGDIIERMFLKLMAEDPDFRAFRPRLAERWRFDEKGLAIWFSLRNDVTWADGEPVTAHDVRFTWELQTDTLVAWPGAQIKEKIRDVEVVDDYTVVFHYTEQYPYQLMDANDGVILPRHILEKIPRAEIATSDFGRAPVGNGPFVFSRWISGQYIELVSNANHYEVPAYVDRVVYRFVPDMITLTTQLKKGEIDALESIPPDQAKELEDNPSIQLYTYPSRRMNFIAWNGESPLFDNNEVRTALTMAINRQEIIETIWGGYAQQCKSPVHPILWAYNKHIRVIPFDTDQAEDLLRAHDWKDRDGDGILDLPDGTRFEFDLLVNNNQQRVDIATMVQAHLKRVGIKVNVRVLEFNTYIQRVLDRDFGAAFVGWRTATKVDLTNMWHSSSIPPNGYNFSSYRNKSVDEWIEKAKVEMAYQKAEDLWYKAQRQIYLDQPFTFLAVPMEVNALHRRFCNVHPNAISFFVNLREWRLAPDCSP